MKLQSVCLRPAPPCTSEFTLNLLMQFRFRVEQELLGIFICKVSACNALAPFTPGIKMFKGLSQMTPMICWVKASKNTPTHKLRGGSDRNPMAGPFTSHFSQSSSPSSSSVQRNFTTDYCVLLISA